jgi:predicted PurR-regulated permease PerM
MSDATRDVQGTDPAHDPRDRITPYAFELDEALLGIELASPSRRLVALLIDLLLAAIIANTAGILVGIVVAFLFFRLAMWQRIDRPLKRWARATLVFVGALVLFVTVLALIESDVERKVRVNVDLSSTASDSERPVQVDEDGVLSGYV